MAALKDPEVEVDSTRALIQHWRIFRLVGLHPPDGATWWGRHYRIYSIVWNFIFHICILTSFVVNFLLSNSLESFCESLCVAMPHTLYMLKLVNVGRMRRKMMHSNRLLRHLDGRLNCDQERRVIKEGVAQANFFFRQTGRGFVCVIIVGILYVIISSERTLMYPTWVPWNWQSSSTSVFVATATAHSMAIIENALVVLNLCTYPDTYLIMLSAHTKALAWRVSRLGHDSRQTREEVYQRLIGCIRDHQTILNLFRLLEESLSMTCFLQFFCTAGIQCTICYFLVFEQIGIMRFLNMLFLLMALTSETLLLCYISELVCQAGDNLLAAAYSCNWLDQPVHFRRLLVFMLLYCQKPLILVAGVVPVSMNTFLAVCKGGYTMLTLLNDMR
ncbi:odorant receptor 19a [Drosophila serrata]|uniref:odorant receptor 19a n=1 Tax=Drosophila serrata TaxID=7274 RepID=UPI000A1D1AEF|nr:odorant receptor 19a [Drosophila serrata]